jgi:hypothetical protein
MDADRHGDLTARPALPWGLQGCMCLCRRVGGGDIQIVELWFIGGTQVEERNVYMPQLLEQLQP